MKLTTCIYSAERGNKAETYQGFTATVEADCDRHSVTLELDNMQRWRSKEDISEYLIWVAREVLKLPT